MGLFSSLFGSAGSDKADKMRQMAIDAFNAIQSPDLKDLQVQLAKYVAAGRLTPEQAEAELLQSNAFNDIVTDPALAGAQKQALTALQDIGTQGGMTAIDKARLKDITNEQNQVAKGRRDAVMSQAQERGMGGSDINTVNQLLEEQSAANRASDQGTDVAAEAQARALQALIASGQTAGQIRGQEFSEGAAKAEAANAIDLFNKQTLNQTNLYNVDAANKAQAANLANEQAISNANVGTTNTERTQNANAHQQVFNNEMAKATGKAGTYNAWAGDASAANRSEKAADMALLGGAVQGVATAFGGPAGAAAAAPAAGSMAANGAQPNTTMTYDELMRNKSSQGFSEGGEVFMENNNQVPQTSLEDEFNSFMARFDEHKMSDGGEVEPDESIETSTAAPSKAAKSGVSSPTDTSTETGGSSPGGASTGGVGSGIGGAGTGGAATGGASTGGAGTVNVTISGNSTTKTSTGSKKAASDKKDAKSSNGDGGNDKKSPININISNVGGKTDAGNVASGDGPGASGKGGSGEGSGGGGGGGGASEPKDFNSSGDKKNQGGMIHDFRTGGRVPGTAKVPGDSPANDIVPAKLSPGELVVPRTIMSDDEEFDAFMEKFRPSRREKPSNSEQPIVAQALQNLSSRGKKIEGR